MFCLSELLEQIIIIKFEGNKEKELIFKRAATLLTRNKL